MGRYRDWLRIGEARTGLFRRRMGTVVLVHDAVQPPRQRLIDGRVAPRQLHHGAYRRFVILHFPVFVFPRVRHREPAVQDRVRGFPPDRAAVERVAVVHPQLDQLPADVGLHLGKIAADLDPFQPPLFVTRIITRLQTQSRDSLQQFGGASAVSRKVLAREVKPSPRVAGTPAYREDAASLQLFLKVPWYAHEETRVTCCIRRRDGRASSTLLSTKGWHP